MESSEQTPIMTISEVATYLKLAESTVYRLVHTGEIPGGKKIGGAWRFSRKEIEAWFHAEFGKSNDLSEPQG